MDAYIYMSILGLVLGFSAYLMFIKSMKPYQRVGYTERYTGVQLEIALFLLPSAMSLMSGTIPIIIVGMLMSFAMSMSEITMASIHRSFPSRERKRALYFKDKYRCDIVKAIKLAQQWERRNGK